MPPKRSKPASKSAGASGGGGGAGARGRGRRGKSKRGDSTPSLFASIAPGSAAAGVGSTVSRLGGFTSGLVGDQSYLRLSTRPLHVLVFLLPLIVFYEAAAAFHVIGGAGGVEETIRARRILSDFFRVFDVGGIYLPGILVFVVLLLWHFLTRDPWRVRWRVVWLMLLEALVWTPPMLVLGQVLYKLMSGSLGAQPPVSAAIDTSALHTFTGALHTLASQPTIEAATASVADPVGADLASRSLMSRAAIAVGAGLYEEMLFRMVGIALFHLILVDLIGMGQKRGTLLAVVLAACAFAFYHDVTVGNASAASVRWADAGFYIFAGVYFGLIYVWRGFGVVVGVHTLYDLAVLVFLTRPPTG